MDAIPEQAPASTYEGTVGALKVLGIGIVLSRPRAQSRRAGGDSVPDVVVDAVHDTVARGEELGQNRDLASG